jgi:hypothetical protein
MTGYHSETASVVITATGEGTRRLLAAALILVRP